MEKKIGMISIILKNRECVQKLNELLSDYGDFIIGRMGIPYKAKSLNIISVVIDAPEEIIRELSVKIELLDAVSVNTAYSDI